MVYVWQLGAQRQLPNNNGKPGLSPGIWQKCAWVILGAGVETIGALHDHVSPGWQKINLALD